MCTTTLLCTTSFPFQSQTGATPLFIAAQHGDTDVTKLLINSGADLNLEKEVTDIHNHLHNCITNVWREIIYVHAWVCVPLCSFRICIVSLLMYTYLVSFKFIIIACNSFTMATTHLWSSFSFMWSKPYSQYNSNRATTHFWGILNFSVAVAFSCSLLLLYVIMREM